MKVDTEKRDFSFKILQTDMLCVCEYHDYFGKW